MFRLKTLLIVFLLLAVPVAESQAHGRATTRRSGLVQAVDQTKHTFTLVPEGETKPVVIEWRTKSGFFSGQKTEFFAGETPATESILKAGVRVQVRYREALFVPNAAVLIKRLTPSAGKHP